MKRNLRWALAANALVLVVIWTDAIMAGGCRSWFGLGSLPRIDVSKLPQAPAVKPEAPKAKSGSTIAEQLDFHTDWIRWAADSVKLDPKALTPDTIDTIVSHAKDIAALGPIVSAEEAAHVTELQVIHDAPTTTMNRNWAWASGIAVLGILGGLVWCFAFDRKVGSGVAGGCLAFCVVAYFFVNSMETMVTILAVVAGIVLVTGGVLVVVALWRHRALFDGMVARFNYVADKPFSAPAVNEAIKNMGPPGLNDAVKAAKARLGLGDPVPLAPAPIAAQPAVTAAVTSSVTATGSPTETVTATVTPAAVPDVVPVTTEAQV